MRRILLIALCLTCFLSYSQDNSIKFRNISIENGLSQSSVNDIIQDDLGFIWIATQDGLNLYDGHEFQVFKHEEDQPRSLINNFITCLFKDDDGNIWIGTQGGLDLMDPVRHTFLHFNYNEANPSTISENLITAIEQDQDGNIWIGTKNKGINVINKDSYESISLNTGNSGLTDNHINDIFLDQKGRVWVATLNGITVYKNNKVLYTYTHKEGDLNTLSSDVIHCITEDQDEVFWIGSAAGIDKLDLVSGRANFSHFSINTAQENEDVAVSRIYIDGPSSAWIATKSNGLYRYFEDQTGASKFYHHTNIHYESSSLIANSIYCIYPDIAGSIWIGTKNGVSRFDALKQGFVHLKKTYDTENTLPSNTIWYIYPEFNDLFWIGTKEGLSRYDRINSSFINHAFPAENPNRRNEKDVYFFTQDSEGIYWMGTADGLFKVDFFNNFKEIERIPVKYKDFKDDENDPIVYTIYDEPDKNRLWVGAFDGVGIIDKLTGDYRFFRPESQNSRSISGERARSFVKDNNGVLWVATDKGLNRIHEKGDSIWFESYLHVPNENSLSNNTLTSILQNSKDVLWIGTYGGGLNKFNIKTGKFKVYTHESHNLTNDAIYGILSDEENQLWISTNNGLSRFDPVSETFTNYDRKDGLQSNEFNTGAFAKTESGELIFGGINGINFFRAKQISINTIAPKVAITGFLINGKEVPIETLASSKEINLSYKDASFTIDFAALHYTNPENNQFKYILVGADKDFVFTSSEYRAHYANLPPGTYTFKVFAANSDGVWTEEPATITIQISTPYWKQTWFQVLMIALAVVIVYAIYWMRVRDIRKQKARLSSLVDQKTQEVIKQKNELEKQQVLLQAEKDKAEELLRNILPEETAEELKSKGKASARHYRRVSIMFTDFKSFTTIAEDMKPALLVAKLDSYFIEFDRIIEKHNLEKIKTIGDAYMCAGGVPVRNKENPIHTVLAALEIQDYMRRRKATDEEEGEESWDLRIGINTGETIAGVIGTKRFAYDIWGNAVNVAARMEAACETDKINISGVTYDFIEPYFDCTYRGKILAKNKGEIDMYYVNGIKPELSIDGLGLEPNQSFWDYVNLHLFSSINYMKAERYIMKLLEKKLSPALHYHSIWHTKDVTESAERIALLEGIKGEDLFLLQTAATYHDAGFVEQYENNEPVGARMAQEILPKFGYTDEQIEVVANLIHATKIPHKPESHLEQIICDADLDYLGRDDFHEIADKLRLELREHGKIDSDRLWDEIQIKFLTAHQYFTKSAINTRQPGKEKNLQAIKDKLARNEYVD